VHLFPVVLAMTVALAAAPPPPDIRPGLVAFEPIRDS
jgi:hypothetical protein